MKLELKHIAGYLPFGLKFKTRIYEDSWLMVGLECDQIKFPNEPTILSKRQDYKNTITIWSRNAKPILRPLSDLAKEIEHNGEKFVPCEILNTDFTGVDSDNLKFATFGIIEKLHEWHFDIHGLIEKGLAIDINTLN